MNRVSKGKISRRGNRSVFMWAIVKMLVLTLRLRTIGVFGERNGMIWFIF